jgi:hypothetical protein
MRKGVKLIRRTIKLSSNSLIRGKEPLFRLIINSLRFRNKTPKDINSSRVLDKHHQIQDHQLLEAIVAKVQGKLPKLKLWKQSLWLAIIRTTTKSYIVTMMTTWRIWHQNRFVIRPLRVRMISQTFWIIPRVIWALSYNNCSLILASWSTKSTARLW